MTEYTYNKIESSRKEYEALPDVEWRKDYFNEENGGYLATSWKRIDESLLKHEPEKMIVEHEMCLVFAKAGFKIRHYEDEKEEGSYDVMINNKKADLKKTRSTNNIIRYSKHALNVQKADITLIEFERWGNAFRNIVSEMSRKGILKVNRQAKLNQPGGERYRPTEVSRPYLLANIQTFFHPARFLKNSSKKVINSCL